MKNEKLIHERMEIIHPTFILERCNLGECRFKVLWEDRYPKLADNKYLPFGNTIDKLAIVIAMKRKIKQYNFVFNKQILN